MFCYALTLAAATFLGQTPGTPNTGAPGTGAATPGTANENRKIEGEWEIVYIEMDGKALKSKDFTNVSIQNNKLTCTNEGKQKSWQLSFQPHFHVRAECLDKDTPQDKRHAHGVYIAGKEYLALSMNHGRDNARPNAGGAQGAGNTQQNPQGAGNTQQQNPQGGANTQQQPNAQGAGTQHSAQGSQFVVILRRPNSNQQ